MDEDFSHWWWALGIATVVGLAAAWYFLWYSDRAPRPPMPAPVAEVAPAPVVPATQEPTIEHPVAPAADPLPSLPALGESDKLMRESAAAVLGKRAPEWLQPQGLARRLVATIDNLPRGKLPAKIVPLERVPGTLVTTRSGSDIVITGENAARYTSYVKAFEAIDATKLAATYSRVYPLLQQAYQELGYPKAYFNDRVVQVIDHLLATPELSGPVRLVQPKVYYEFADEELESRSAGQKILLRMGNENAARVKTKLREIRQAIAAQGSASASLNTPAKAGDVPASGPTATNNQTSAGETAQ